MVTRERPKIDRVACPWLINRFIDEEPEFLYVPKRAGNGKIAGTGDFVLTAAEVNPVITALTQSGIEMVARKSVPLAARYQSTFDERSPRPHSTLYASTRAGAELTAGAATYSMSVPGTNSPVRARGAV
jgi:hypothetical protein